MAKMAEYIERQTAINKIRYRERTYGCVRNTYSNAIKNLPAADVAPVVHGYWEDIYQRDIYIPDEKTTMTLTEEKCSNCSIVTKFIGDKLFLHDFVCPNCGAKMDGKDNGSNE